MTDKAQLLKRLVVIVAVTVISLMLRTDSEAVTYWEDDFENHLNSGTPFNPWDACADPACPIDGSNPGISTDFAVSGTHSLKGHYTGLDSGNWIDRLYTTTSEVWTRFYYRTTNFTYNNVGTKHFNVGDGVHYPNFWISNNAGRRDMMIYGQIVADTICGTGGSQGAGNFDDCLYYANVKTINLNDNQWYCVETHIKMNTPGVADGIVEVWVDGVQTVNYPNRLFRGGQVSGTNGNSSQAAFSMVRIYVQHGVGDMYYDRFAVGDTRIPCVGAASPAGLTPTPPTNPQVR